MLPEPRDLYEQADRLQRKIEQLYYHSNDIKAPRIKELLRKVRSRTDRRYDKIRSKSL